jgi:hypothetical protein
MVESTENTFSEGGVMTLHSTDHSFTFNKNGMSLTIDKDNLKTIEYPELSANLTGHLICGNVHGIIGVVNIHAFNYLIIATGSNKKCSVPG